MRGGELRNIDVLHVGEGNNLVLVAQFADLGELIVVVASNQLGLFLLVDEETVHTWSLISLALSDAVFFAGHCEASSSPPVVDIVAQVHHHQLPLRSLLTQLKNLTCLLVID